MILNTEMINMDWVIKVVNYDNVII
jgi:hypothetical protein